MTPILCVGETLEEREAGATEDKVLGQVTRRARRVSAETGGDGWWSRTSRSGPSAPAGPPRPTTPRQSAPRSARVVAEAVGAEAAAAVRIQYGGSVKSANIAELMAAPDIDGALVGGASLDPDEILKNRQVSD